MKTGFRRLRGIRKAWIKELLSSLPTLFLSCLHQRLCDLGSVQMLRGEKVLDKRLQLLRRP